MSETRFVDSFIRWGSLAAVQGVGIGSAVDVHDVQPLVLITLQFRRPSGISMVS
jgi:hypothetical protein